MVKFFPEAHFIILIGIVLFSKLFSMQEILNPEDWDNSLKIIEDTTLQNKIKRQSSERTKKRTRRTSYRNQPEKIDENNSPSDQKLSEADKTKTPEQLHDERLFVLKILAKTLPEALREIPLEQESPQQEAEDEIFYDDELEEDAAPMNQPTAHTNRQAAQAGNNQCCSFMPKGVKDAISQVSRSINECTGPLGNLMCGKCCGG